MSWVSLTAIFYVIWWITLFAILPFNVKTQEDEGAIVPGTMASAPGTMRMLRAVIWTTVISLIIVGILFGLTEGLGLGFSDLPQMLPTYD